MDKLKYTTQELTITSDVYITQDGAAYGSPSDAIKDGADNCLIGTSHPELPDDHIRKVKIVFHCTSSDSIPTQIDIIDNGIGMDIDTILKSLFVTNKNNKSKNANILGGTSRWGMGYKALTNYLGTPGVVVSRTIEQAKKGLPGVIASVVYEDGKPPKTKHAVCSEERFLAERNCGLLEGHGTKITITDIKKEKWPKSWWKPKGQTFHRDWECRYHRLLSQGKLQIELILKEPNTPAKTRILEAAEYILDNNPAAIVDYKKGGYIKSSRNEWNVIETIKIDGYTTEFPIKIGKHLAPMQKAAWEDLGSRNLLAGSSTKSQNPTIRYYESDILISTVTFKGSDRDAGLSHLNGLYVEIDVPADVKVPTNVVKNKLDTAFTGLCQQLVQIRAEQIWKPSKINEAAYHKQFEDLLYHNMKGAGIRSTMFDSIPSEELKTIIKHEDQSSSFKPDWKQFTDSSKTHVRRIVEMKDEIADTSVTSQVAAYLLDNPEAIEIIVIAPGFSQQVKQIFHTWNDKASKRTEITAKFTTYTFDEIGMHQL
jgi:hypothetical protein